jgi:opacity protein-like surface antigen
VSVALAEGDLIMPRTATFATFIALLSVVLLATPVAAQQSLSFNVGSFALRGEGSRVAGDTIVENQLATPPFALEYRVSDFNNATFGVEWLFPLGEFLEGGVGANYYARTVPSFYRDLVNKADGSDITQDLRLRTIPMTATIRFIPTGRRAGVQPYIGAGVGVVAWRYSETGDFLDPNRTIFQWEYKDSGTAVGPVVFGGIRVPVSHTLALGGEIRYQKADAPLNRTVGFQGDRLDVGGITYQANFIVRF